VSGVAEGVGRGQHRPCGKLLADVLRPDVAQLEVVALQRHQLRALLEQRAAEEGLDLVVGLDVLGDHPGHVGADVLVREHGGKAQRRLVLRQAGISVDAATAALVISAERRFILRFMSILLSGGGKGLVHRPGAASATTGDIPDTASLRGKTAGRAGRPTTPNTSHATGGEAAVDPPRRRVDLAGPVRRRARQPVLACRDGAAGRAMVATAPRTLDERCSLCLLGPSLLQPRSHAGEDSRGRT